MIEKLYTVEEVAEMASVTGRTIRNYLKSGKLVGRKIGGQWRFPESEVQRLLNGESMDEYTPQNGSTAPNINASPQNFNTNVPTQQEQNYIQNPYPTQAPSSFSNPSSYSPTYENIPTQNPEGISRNTSQTSYAQQPYATASFPAQKPYTQPIQQTTPQNNYGEPINTGNSFSNTPSATQQPLYSQPQTDYVAPSYTSSVPSSSLDSQNYVPSTPSYQPTPQPVETYEPSALQNANNLNNQFSQNTTYEPYVPYEPYDPYDYDYSSPTPTEPQYSSSAQDTSAKQSINNYPVPDTTVPEISDLLDAYVEQVSSSTASGNYQSASQASKDAAKILQDAVSEVSEELDNEENSEISFSDLSDVGKQVGSFLGEVHDCSNGPQICAVIDLYQSLEAAKITSQHITEMAEIESENGIQCDCFVEYDSRYYVARYTLFGSSYYLAQCLDLIG